MSDSIDHKKLVVSAIKKATTNKDVISVERFAGFLAFFLALGTVFRLIEEEQVPQGRESEVKSHVQRGVNFAKRERAQIAEATKAYFGDYAGKMRFRTLYRKLLRGKKVSTFIIRLTDLMEALLPRLMRDMSTVREIFSGRSLITIRQIDKALVEEGSLARLHKLAAMSPAPGLAKEHQWIVKAASIFDVGISEVEVVASMAGDAKDLATELQKIKNRLSSLDPTSKDAVTLESRRRVKPT